MNFKKNILLNKPDISESSIRAYEKNLIKISKTIDIKKIDKIKEYLKDYSISTKKNYMVALMVYFGKNYDKYNELLKYFIELRKNYDIQIETSIKSEKEHINWISLKKLIKIQRKNERIFKALKLTETVDKLKIKEFNIMNNYLISSLYTLCPPQRNNWASVEIINNYNQIKDDKNYLLVLSRNRKILIISDYKTKKHYGEIRLNVNKKLNSVFNKILKLNNTKYLILNKTRKEPVSNNHLTKLINRAFKASNKKISSTMIRHIYLSDKYGSNYEDRKEDSKMMFHSLETQNKYIKI